MLMELLGSLPLAMKSSIGTGVVWMTSSKCVLFQQIIGQTEVVADVKYFVEGRAAQVRIHDHHALAGLGEDGGEIQGGGGFAFAHAGADDDDAVELVVLAGEQEVSAQDPVGLGMLAVRPFIQQITDILRNDAQHRRLERAFHLVNGLNAGVQIFNEEGQTDADHQADDHAQNDVQRFVRADGVFARFGPAHNFHHGGLGNLHIKFFGFNLGGQQPVKIQHVFQLAFCLPIRLASRGVVQVFLFCLIHRVGQRIQRGLLGLHLVVQARHDAADPVINFIDSTRQSWIEHG